MESSEFDWVQVYSGNQKAFGEVVSSTHKTFSVQSYKINTTPEYGSFIVVNCESFIVVGAVTGTEMVPSPGLPSVPTPLKATRKEIIQRYPDLEDRFIDIYFCVSVGYFEKGTFFQKLPRRKPLIHDLAYIPSKEFVKQFHFRNGKLEINYLPLLINSLNSSEVTSFLETFFPYLTESLGLGYKMEIYERITEIVSERYGEEKLQEVLSTIENIVSG